MAYATLTDVQLRMPQFTLSDTTKPSSSAAQAMLDDAHAHFEASIENLGYVVPLTGAKSISLARDIVSQGTIARILYARAAGVGTDAAFQSADRAQKRYDDMLMQLSPGHPLELIDAARTGQQIAKPRLGAFGLIYDDNGDEIEPRITMRAKF